MVVEAQPWSDLGVVVVTQRRHAGGDINHLALDLLAQLRGNAARPPSTAAAETAAAPAVQVAWGVAV
jgi:hypothetical protein